jgi:hypothetical protein
VLLSRQSESPGAGLGDRDRMAFAADSRGQGARLIARGLQSGILTLSPIIADAG